MPATPPVQAHQIPLITRTGPNCPGGQGQLITIIRQRSHPERGSNTSGQNELMCKKCTRCPSWAGLNSGDTCPQTQLSIPQYGRSSSIHLTPKRYSSVSSSEEFASIAADTMKINGALKQFKQVCSNFRIYYWLKSSMKDAILKLYALYNRMKSTKSMTFNISA